MKEWITIQQIKINSNKDSEEIIDIQILAELDENEAILRDDSNKWRIISSKSKKTLYSVQLYSGMIRMFKNSETSFIVFIESNDFFIVKQYVFSKIFNRSFCRKSTSFTKFKNFKILE